MIKPKRPREGNGVALVPWQDPDATPLLRIEGVTKNYGAVYAVDNVSLDVYPGEFFSLLGASGCGKTTLLRMLAGLERPSTGRIVIDGQDMTDVPPYERPVNIMFQSYALFPHMTVEQNVAFGLKQERLPKTVIVERTREMLELVRMKDFAKRRPHQLSGGQRQRVALARSLAKHPKLLLLDEPLGALDRALREHTQFELVNIQERTGITFITVTHDQEEAMTMSSRIAVMNEGRIAQIGTPPTIYEYPANRFVADFIGAANLFEGRVTGMEADNVLVRCDSPECDLLIHHPQPLVAGTPVTVALRPEKLTVSRRDKGHLTNGVRGVIQEMAYLGDVSIFHVRTEDGAVVQAQVTNLGRLAEPKLTWDQEVTLTWQTTSGALLLA
ncbi:MAG: ABC transporter ATP-binding protein [Alphaproteobacteria bacterium RIFOXYD12_FULL_60_8]|nr:MAG: ABC transporter ATP-binding protein [Alphaproteobacteria bacterium RIFOXYD12_FULL_60_8]